MGHILYARDNKKCDLLQQNDLISKDTRRGDGTPDYQYSKPKIDGCKREA